MKVWPEILQAFKQDDDGNTIVEFTKDLWPNAGDLDSFAELDDEGWNLYADQNGEDWYSFVENETPPANTVASITHYYGGKSNAEDEYREEVEVSRGEDFDDDSRVHEMAPFRAIPFQSSTPQKPMPFLSPLDKHRDYSMLPPKSSPSSKIRSSLGKLACFIVTPEKKLQHGDDGDHFGLLGQPSPPMRLGALSHRFPLDDDYENEEYSTGDDDAHHINPENQSMHNASKIFRDKGVIVSLQELDHYCGSKTVLSRPTNDHLSTPTAATNDNDEDDGSIQSCNSSTQGNGTRDTASSLAGCTIDSELARALAFRCTPEKTRQELMDKQDYGRSSNSFVRTSAITERDDSVARKVVADRRKWLLAAFKKSQEQDEENKEPERPIITRTAPNDVKSGTKNEARHGAQINARNDAGSTAGSTDTRNRTAINSTTSNRKNDNLDTKINQFGGRPARPKTAVQRRKEQWEKKLAQTNADRLNEEGKPLRVKTEWKCNEDGSYKKRTVVKAAE